MPFEPPDDGLEFPKSRKLLTVDSAAAVDALNHAFAHGAVKHASVIIIEEQSGSCRAVYEDGVGEQSSLELSANISEVSQALDHRCFHWPDVGDRLWHTSSSRRRVLSLSVEGPQYLADVTFQHQPGAKSGRLLINNISWGSAFSIGHRFEFTESNSRLLQRLGQAKTGIIAANAVDGREPAGTAVILALRPDAVFVSSVEAAPAPGEVLDLASKRLVVLAVDGQDAVELLTKTVGAFQPSGSGARAAGVLNGSLVHLRLPRVCTSCARSAPADPATINFLPASLRPSRDKTFMVGRGCDSCVQSGFRGSVGVDSVVECTPRLRDVLSLGSAIDQVTELAYRNGTRSLLEDALVKAGDGLTTLDSVTKSVKRPSAAFEASIVNAGDETLTLKDRDINSSLSSLGDDFFLAPSGGSPAADSAHPESLLRREPRAKRILIVEDDSDQQQILRLVLEKEGYEVAFAGNGAEGLEQASRVKPDLIITDLMMPKMDGNEFVARLRETPEISGMKILVLTVIDNADAEHKLLTTGADDYCAKTVRRDVLLKRIERLLARR